MAANPNQNPNNDLIYTPAQLQAMYAALPGPSATDTANYNKYFGTQGKGGREGDGYANTVNASQAQVDFLGAMESTASPLRYNAPNAFESIANNVIPLLAAGGAGAAFAPAIAAELGVAGNSVATGAIQGGLSSTFASGLTGQPITAGGVLTGAATGALGGSQLGKDVTYGLTDVYGVPTGLASGISGAATGAAGAALTGKNAAAGAITGGVGGLANSTLGDIGAGSTLSGIGGKLAGGTVAGLLTGSNQGGGSNSGTAGNSTVPSSTGGSKVSSTSINDPMSGGLPAIPTLSASSPSTGSTSAAPSTTGLGGFVSSLGTGLASSLGIDPNNIGGSLGSTLGGLGPYAAVGALGLSQAQSGRAQDQTYVNQAAALGKPLVDQSNTMLSNYNSGTLSPTDQRVVDTATAQGKTLIDAANPLSGIAATAFQNYSTGTLPAWQQQQLDQQTAAQKQQVASALQSQGITDSSVLQAQYQQIDNQAAITKGQLVQSQFSLGTQAYDEWMKGTQAGQQAVLDGYKFASTELNNTLQSAFQASQIGSADVMASIQMAMQTDAQYSQQVSELMGTLATAYAYQQAKQAGAGGTSAGGIKPATSAGGGSSTPSVGGGGSPTGTPGTSNFVDSGVPTGQTLPGIAASGAIDPNALGLGSTFGNDLTGVTQGNLSQAGDALASTTTDPFGGWLSSAALGGG